MALTMWGQLIIQAATPGEDPVQVGTLWVDTSGTATLKVCTSISPYTFTEITGGSGAPTDADYLVKTANASLSAERVVTDGTSITADWSAAGQVTFKRAALTGDVTASVDANATTIANDAVTFAKMQNIATDSLIGRDTAATGDPENILLNATLSMDGSGNLQRAALTGDVTAAAGSNATTIANNAVSDVKLRDSGALSVIGRSANSSGDPADISATATSAAVLRESGSTIGFGTVATAGLADDAVTYAKIQNVSATSRVLGRKTAGAGDTEECTLSEVLDFIGSAAQGDVLYRGAASWARLAAGTSGQFLKTNGSGANPEWATGSGTTNPVRVLDRDVVEASVVNTTTETTVYSFSVPGGTLGSTKHLRLTAFGEYRNQSGGGDTSLRTKVAYGATNLLDDTSANITNSGSRRMFTLRMEIAARNATDAQISSGEILIGAAGTTSGGQPAAPNTGYPKYAAHHTLAEDSTAAKTLAITVQHGGANVDIEFRMFTVVLELLD